MITVVCVALADLSAQPSRILNIAHRGTIAPENTVARPSAKRSSFAPMLLSVTSTRRKTDISFSSRSSCQPRHQRFWKSE
jgi:hypothetical protein